MSESENREDLLNEEESTASFGEELKEANEKAEKQVNKKATKADKKLAEALAERDDFKDKYLRTFSDFNNYRKRVASTRAEALLDGRCEAVEKILPVLDNFERALEHIDDAKDDAIVQGFTMVYRQLVETVEKLGVHVIPAQGEVFDPTKHQAIQMVEPQEGQESGTVAEVIQKGYAMQDRIIRSSMVVVYK